MTNRFKMIGLALMAAIATTAVPAEAGDRGRHRGWDNHRAYERGYDRGYDRRRYDERRYSYRGRDCRRSSGTTGLLLGGVAGALLGREVDKYGDRTPGTVIGAGAGALAGRAIDRGGSRC